MNAMTMRGPAGLMMILALAGCPAVSAEMPERPAGVPVQSPTLASGLEALSGGQLEEAARHFQAALKLNPQDATAHMALATTYHLQARKGDMNARSLAEVGYQQALQLNPSGWLAAYRLGLLELETERYGDALGHLSLAALKRPDDPEVLNALAAAAYYTGQMDLAQNSIRKAMALSEQASIRRNAAMIAAAGGDTGRAGELLAGVEVELPPEASAFVRRRIQDWGFQLASGETPAAEAMPADTTESFVAESGLQPATRSPFLPLPDSSSSDYRSSSVYSTMMAPLPKPASNARARMVQVDAVVLRTEEIESRTRGVNLLEGLQIQFSGNTRLTGTHTVDADGNRASSFERVVTRAIGIPEINYSLNIANDHVDHADIVARPTLVALDGQPANFFSGEEVSIPITGNFSSTLVDKKIGIELAVTRTFLDEDTVLLSVNASRSFISPMVDARHSLTTTQQKVTTAVAVDFGQTLVLSGLTERQTGRTRSGVPILQDIPGVQYLFSTNDELLYRKSVLILLTPRHTGSSQPPKAKASDKYRTMMLDNLRHRYPDFFAHDSNAAVSFGKLLQHKHVGLFERGDMEVETWQAQRNFVQQILSTLYY